MPSDRHLLLQDFTPAQKQAFLGLGALERHAVQEVLLEEHLVGDEMLIIEEGVVSVWVRDVKISEVGAESIIGVSALIEPHPRTATLIAETEVRARRFARARVLKHLEGVSAKLFHTFFVNAFRIHLNLVRQCEQRIVQLDLELNTG